jgi:hypothetical protein
VLYVRYALSLGLGFDDVDIGWRCAAYMCFGGGNMGEGQTKQVGLSAANNKKGCNSHCQVLLLLDAAVGGLGVLCR